MKVLSAVRQDFGVSAQSNAHCELSAVRQDFGVSAQSNAHCELSAE